MIDACLCIKVLKKNDIFLPSEENIAEYVEIKILSKYQPLIEVPNLNNIRK